MLQGKQSVKKSINLSFFLSKMLEYATLSSKATFWFGGILSLIEDNAKNDIHDDTTLEDKIEIIRINSKALAAIANFYQQERPNSVYKLLNFTEGLLDQLQANRQYTFIMVKVTYLNALSIYALKTRQYAYALNIFAEILQIFHSKVVDNANEPFLAFLNNYLALLRRSSKKMTSRMMEVEGALKETYIKFFTKVMVVDKAASQESLLSSMHLLTAIFKTNQNLFSKYERDVNSLILHSYQAYLKAKKKIPEDMISFIFKEKIKREIYFGINFSEDQVKFYSGHKNKFAQSLMMRRHMEDDQPDKKLNKIEAMLEQSIEMLSEQKLASTRYATLQKNNVNRFMDIADYYPMKPALNISKNTLESQPSRNFQTLQPLPRTFTRKRNIQPIRPIKPITKIVRFKAIVFKIRSIFIQMNEDGILLSDYTKQNKRYVEWNTLSLIIDRLQHHFPFEQMLKVPVQNYYDFVRIISFYLTKDDNKEICLVAKPLPLLQVNQLIKLYKQQGKYLKLALMNHYDSQKFIGVVDCYVSEFSQFFKYLNQNEYLILLNQKISKGSNNYDKDESTYLLDYIKRKRETTVAQLGNQLQSQHLQYALQEKNTIYKCIFLLKNNLQLYVRIMDNVKPGMTFEGLNVEIKIDNVSNIGNETFYLSSQKQININDKKISKNIELPIEKLTYYVPPYSLTPKDYLSLYSRPIIDMLNSFDEHAEGVNLGGLQFEVKVHASRTDMIEYGRYYSVVSAEVIGSSERAWAMVIRYYDQAYLSQKVTLLMNPYYQFLQCLISANQEQKRQIMKNLLVNQSVKQTYNWLKRNNKLERRLNLFQYLYANQLI